MKSRKVLLGLIVGFCVSLVGTVGAQTANYQNSKLIEIGPDNIGGRVTSLIVHHHEGGDTSVLYAGAATGGMYTRTNQKEDLWQYLPCYVNNKELTLPISCLLKLDDSIILVGTGESFYAKGSNLVQMGGLGRGIFKYNVNNTNYSLVPATNPGTDFDHNFASVNVMAKMASQGSIYLYVGTQKGLFRWVINSNGEWTRTPAQVWDGGNVRSLVVSKKYNMAFFTSGGRVFKISDIVNNSQPVEITGTNSAFGDNVLAIDLALAPSDESMLYAMVAGKNGMMNGLYLTTNANSWRLLSTSTVTPYTSAATAKSCGAIAVSPNDSSKVYLGGAAVWVGKGYVANSPYQWTVSTSNENQLNFGDYMATVYSNSKFVHSGIRQIVADSRWNETTHTMYEGYYFVTDGGVYYSNTPDIRTIENYNRGMNTVQINGLAVCPDGSILAGANSNACPFIESRMDHNGGMNDDTWYDHSRSNTNHLANILWKGNGGKVAASRFTQYQPLSRRNIFVSSSNGSIGRAFADFSDYTQTQTWTSDSYFMTDLIEGGPAIGQIVLWENDNNKLANDSMTFIIDTLSYIIRNGEKKNLSQNFRIQAGDSILVLDKSHASYPFYHEFDHSFTVREELVQTVHMPYVSRMLAVTVETGMPQNTNVSYCWFPTDFSKVFDNSNDTRFWSHIYGVNGSAYPHMYVRYTAMSQDGDCAFVVVENDTLKQSFIARVHGLNRANYNSAVHVVRDALNYKISTRITNTDTIMVTADNYMFGRRISSISVDPREGRDAIIVTFDGYNAEGPNVVYINNASGEYTIQDISLPDNSLPAFSAMIECTKGDVFVGTEDGAYKATSIPLAAAHNWEEYGSFRGVPVTAMYQVTTDYPMIQHLGHDGISEEQYVFPSTKWPYAMYFGTYGRGIFMDSTFVKNHKNEIVTPEIYLGVPTVVSNSANSIRLYPNPAISTANLELDIVSAGKTVVNVYDLSGKIVYSKNLGTLAEGVYNHTIDCQNLMKGMYLVNVTVGGQKSTSKLIVR